MEQYVEVVNPDSRYFNKKGIVEEFFPEGIMDKEEVYKIKYLNSEKFHGSGMFKKSELAFLDIE